MKTIKEIEVNLKFKMAFTMVVTILIWSILFRDYFNDGVPAPHLFHRPDFPTISNWWGGLVLPIFTWICLLLIGRNSKKNDNVITSSVFLIFSIALVFSTILSFLFTNGWPGANYMMLSLLVISFFYRLHRPEFLLGFVLGMTYSFGAVLPIVVGSIFMILLFLVNKIGMISQKTILGNNRQIG